MKKGFFLSTLFFPLIICAQSPQIEEDVQYKVHIIKENETLSQILWKHNFKPLYGKANWVEKILRINHLSAEQAKDLKKDLPIIIPTKKSRELFAKKKVDQIKTIQSSTIHYGLVGNKISKHQDILVDFAVFERQGQIRNKTISQTGNFKLGLSYEDKNSRSFGTFKINPQFDASVSAMAPARFNNGSQLAVTYQPTYELKTNFLLDHPAFAYQFGPYVQVLEQSSLDSETQDDFFIRRDRFANLGIMAQNIYERNNIEFHFDASLGTTILSQNLGDESIMQMVTSRFNSKVNLTKDYFIGAFWESNFFTNTSQRTAQNLGINLTYNIK